MTEEKKKKIQANIERTNARAEGRLSGANTNRDRANQSLGNYFAGTYIPQKANAYTQGVSDFNQRYTKYLDRTQSQKQYQSPDTFTRLEQQRQSAYENPNKQYAQMYARMQLEQGNNAPFQTMYGLGEASEKQKQSISGLSNYYSQFGSKEGYNNAMEQRRLLSYDIEDAKRRLEQLKANQPDRYGFNYDARGNQSNTTSAYSSWEEKVKALESEISLAEQTKQFYEDMKDPVKRAEYESYMQEQKSLEHRYSQMNPIEKTAHQLGQGIVNMGTQYGTKFGVSAGDVVYGAIGNVMQGIGNTISYDSPFAPIGQGLREASEGLLSHKNEQMKQWQEYFDYIDRYSAYYKQGLTTDIYNATGNADFANFAGDAITITRESIIQAIPMMLMASATGGASLGTSAGTMLQASTSGNAVAKYANIATKMIQNAAKNPSFWMSFGAEGGAAYLDALKNGATETEAGIAMLATGLPNALIEIGSGIETIPTDRSVKGIRNWLKTIGKSAHEEGMEEIQQGIISQLVGQLVTDDIHLFSADGQTGVIDPVRMVQEYYGGFVGGSVGGVKVGYINYKTSQAQKQFQDFKVATIKKEGSLEKMKDIVEYASNSELTALYNDIASNTAEASREECIKLYDMLMDAADGTATNIIETNLSDNYGVSKSNAAEIAPIIQSLSYDNKLTIDQAEVLANNPEISRVLGTPNISAEELVAISQNSTELQDVARVLALSRSEIDNFIADQVRIDERAKQAIDMIGLKNTTSAMGIKGIAPMAIERNGVTEEISIADSSAGRVLVRTPLGETFDAEDAPFARPETQTLVQLAGDYNTDTANTFVNAYPANMDMGEYASLFADVYNLAKTSKYSLQGLYRLYAPLTSHPSVIRDAYNAAIHEIAESRRAYEEKQASRRAKQKRNKGKVQISEEAQELVKKEYKTFADFIAKATKYTVRIIFDEKTMAQGKFNSTETEIVINLAKGDFFSTMLHEVTHFIELNNVEGYNAFANEVMKYLSTKGILKETFERYAVTYSGEIESIDELSSEVAANAAESLMKSEDFLKELFTDKDFIQHIEGTEAQSFVNKVIAKLKEILDSIKQFMADATLNHKVAEVFAKDTEQLNRMVKLWTDAFKGAAMSEVQSIAKENTDTESSGGKMSIGEGEVIVLQKNNDLSKRISNLHGSERYKIIANYILSELSEQPILLSDGKKAIVDKSDASHIAKASGEKKATVIFELKELIQKSQLFAEERSTKERKFDYFYYYKVNVKYGKDIFPIFVNVGRARNDATYHIYDITQKLRDTAHRVNDVERLEKSDALKNSISENSLSYSLNNVNPDSKNSLPETDSKGKFSLSEPVEKVGSLVAVHNLDAKKLQGNLELGGLPAPSIAVTKSEIGHSGYGDISLVFASDTINPESDSRNDVYSADAYTSRFPQIDIRFKPEALRGIADRLDTSVSNLEANEFSQATVADIVESLKRNNTALKAFISENNIEWEPVLRAPEYRKPIFKRDAIRKFFEDNDIITFGQLVNNDDALEDFPAVIEGAFGIKSLGKKWADRIMSEIADAKSSIERYDVLEAEYENDFAIMRGEAQPVKDAWSDFDGMKNAVKGHSDEYDLWLYELVEPAVDKRYVRRNVEQFDSKGNRKSFEQLHDEYNLDGILKNMARGTNVESGFLGSGIGEMRAALSRKYKSLDELRTDSDNVLLNITPEDVEEIFQKATTLLSDIISEMYSYTKYKSDNSFMDMDNVSTNILDAFIRYSSDSRIKSYLKEYYPSAPDSLLDKVIELKNQVKNLPAKYFEAKPFRAVGFDEVRYAIVPSGTDTDVISQLESYGVEVVEYEKDNESDRVSKLNSLDDVKFSLPESDTASYDILARDNVRLQNQVKHLENEMKLTEGHKMKPEAVSKLARKLKKDYYSTLSAEEIAAELTKIFEYIADTENASGDIAMRAMHSLAKRIVDSSQKLDTTLADEYKNVTEYLRKTKIRVSPGMEAELDYLYGKYNNFRRANFGRLSLSRDNGSAIDSVWQELNSLAPELFPEEAFPDSDMLPRIAEVLDMIAPEYVNPYGQDTDSFVSGLASEIFDSYFDTPEIRTFADKKAAELRKAVNKSRQHLAQLRAKDRARYQERYEKLKADSKEKLNAVKADNKRKTAEKLLKQKAKYQDMAKRKIEKRAATVLRHKIIKKALPLADRLIHPEKNKYVPIGLQKFVAEFLSTLDLDSHKLYKGNPTRFTEKLKSLYVELGEFKKTDDADMLTDTAHIESLILSLTDVTEGKSIYDLDVADLEEVYKLVTALDTFVRQSVNVTLEGKKLELEDTSLEVIREIAKARSGGKFKKLIEFGVTGKESSLNAYRILDGLGNYDDASVFHRIAVELRNREKVMMDLYNEGSEIFRELANDKKAMDKFFGDKAEWVDIGIKDSNGNPVKITHAMLVSIYLMSLDEGNRAHISTGGLTIPTDQKAYKKGEDVYKNAVTVRLTPEQLLAIAGKMNDFDKKFAKAVQTFFDSFSKKYINETSVKILGYELAQIENYFPVISDENFLGKNFEQMFNVTLSSYGSLKSRIKNATTPVKLLDVVNVVDKHLDFVTKYAAYAEIAQDLKRIYNYRRNLSNVSVQKAIGDKFGKAGNGFFENLIETVNDAKPKEFNFIDKRWSRATTATLAVNVSSTLKQFAAFPMAAATLGYEPLLKAMKHGVKKAPKELIRKYTGMLEYRLGSGNITAEMSSARMGKDLTKRMPMLMDWLNKMDGAIVGRLWYASEYYVDDNFKELKKGSDEYYTKVAEIFTDTVFETQANYTFMERAGIQSVRWLKPFTAFKTDAYQAFGLLYDRTARHRQAVREYKELLKNGGTEEQKKVAKAKVQATRKTMVTAYSAVILSNVTTTLAAVLATTILRKWDRVKDDEEEEVNFEGYLKYAISEFLGNLSGLITFGNQIADIISVLMNKGKWYDIEDMGLAAINDFITNATNTVTGLYDLMTTDTSEMTDEQYQNLVDKTTSKIINLAISSSKILGIPLGNALNIGGALKGWVGQFTGNDWDEDKEKSSKAKYNSIYNAYISGDTERYERLYDELIAEGTSDTTIKTQMKRRLYEQDSRVKEAAIASEEGRFVDYVDLVKDLVEDTGLSEGFVSDAVDYAIDKMNKKPTSNTATSDSTDAYGIMSGGVYGMNQLITATKDMNTANISKIYNSVYEEKLDYYLDEGYKKSEAEAKAKSSIKSSITSKIKPIVQDLYKTNKDKFAKLRTFLMKYLGYDSKTVNNWTNE